MFQKGLFLGSYEFLNILLNFESQNWGINFDVSKFFNTFTKNGLYGTITCAEYKSGVRKILKNFPGTLESHKVFRHFATLAITF